MPLTINSALSKDKRNAKADVMQHRHFAVVAGVINKIEDVETRIAVAEHFARQLQSTNRAFNRARFLNACMTYDK